MAAPRSRSRSRSRAQQPSRFDAAIPHMVTVVASILALVATYFGLPGLVVAWVGFTMAAWSVQAPELSGTDANRNPVPAGPGEQRKMRTFNFARSAKWGLVFPMNSVWPGWPVRAAFLMGVLAAAAAFFLPYREFSFVPTGVFALANAVAAHVLVTVIAAARRDSVVLDDRSPGVRIDALTKLWHPDHGHELETPFPRQVWFVLAGVATAAGAALGFFVVGPLLGTNVIAWTVISALAALGAFVAPAWVTASLWHWRMVVAARAEWAPSWEMLKQPNPPRLVDRRQVGPAVVDSFVAHGSVGAAKYLTMSDQILATRGAPVRISVGPVETKDSNGQPMPGSVDPLGFEVVSWPNDIQIDVTDPSVDVEVVELFVGSALIWACAEWNVHPMVNELTLLSPTQPPEPETPAEPEDGAVEDGEPAAPSEPEPPAQVPPRTWQLTWHGGIDANTMRLQVAGILGGQLGCEIAADHRPAGPRKPQPAAVYFGNLSGAVLDPNQPVTAEYLGNLMTEDQWNSRWTGVLKGVNYPTYKPETYSSAKLPNGIVIEQQGFVTRQAQPPESFFGKEKELRATMSGAPFMHITGWPTQDRPGTRHTQAFCVRWSSSAVPQSPDTVPPDRESGSPHRGQRGRVSRNRDSNLAQSWVLGGQMAGAFAAARLAMPEVVSVEPLTNPRGRQHIWKITLRLHGGVTLVDVRAAQHRIRQHLGSEWLRVTTAPDGCTIVAGVEPRKARFVSDDAAKYATALDWEQAFIDAKVVGVGGITPTLTRSGRLPDNEQVQSLDFTLPTGLAFVDVKAGSKKLETSSRNAFVEVRRPSSGMADEFLVLASEVNPMPERAAFDFEKAEAVDHKIPFATNLFGEAVAYDNSLDAHLLVSGVSGGGKSVALQAFVYGAVIRGWDLWIADPSKGGVDFQFAEPWSRAFARTVWETKGMIAAIYDEVMRRKAINAEHNCGNYRDLPEDVRYPHVLIVLDEFTSMMMPEPVPKAMDDSEETLRAVESVKAINAARAYIGTYVGKIVREARSTGFTMLLATQALKADTLAKIPGANDLKDNMSRMIVGRASFGQLAAALKMPTEAPEQPDVLPPGRGLYEGGGFTAQTIQVWFEGSQQVFAQQIAERRPPIDPSKRLDMSVFVEPELEVEGGRIDDEGGMIVTHAPMEVSMDEIVELDEIEFTLDDLAEVDPEFEMPAPEPESEPEPVNEASFEESTDEVIEEIGESIVWDEIDPTDFTPEVSQYGWGEIDALEVFLSAFDQVRHVEWTDEKLWAVTDLGITFADVAREVLADRGVTLHTGPDPRGQEPAAPAPVPDIPAPAPTPAALVTVPADDDPFAAPPKPSFDVGPNPFE